MKKLLVVLALLTISTLSFASDRYTVLAGVMDGYVVIVDTKTGNIAWCNIVSCMVGVDQTFEDNFKKAFAGSKALREAEPEQYHPYKKKNK